MRSMLLLATLRLRVRHRQEEIERLFQFWGLKILRLLPLMLFLRVADSFVGTEDEEDCLCASFGRVKRMRKAF